MLFLTRTFGHTNSWAKFKLPNGDPLRPFTSTEEMDETMVERWNAKVSPNDTVYHLGDVVINRKSLHHVKRLNGKKRLILGNHDIFKNKDYYDVGFETLYGCRVFVDQFILSHIPYHPDCITDRFKVNIHGHLHANEITRKVRLSKKDEWFDPGKMTDRIFDEPDPRYFCTSVERINYTPISFEELEIEIQKRFDLYNYSPAKGYFNGSVS